MAVIDREPFDRPFRNLPGFMSDVSKRFRPGWTTYTVVISDHGFTSGFLVAAEVNGERREFLAVLPDEATEEMKSEKLAELGEWLISAMKAAA